MTTRESTPAVQPQPIAEVQLAASGLSTLR